MSTDWRDVAHTTLINGLSGPLAYQGESAVLDHRDGLILVKGRVNHPWFNVMVRTSNDLPAVDAWNRAESFFAGDRSDCIVLARDWIDADITDEGVRRGFKVEGSYPYMIAEGSPPPFELPDGVTINSQPSEQFVDDIYQLALTFKERPNDPQAFRDFLDPNEIFVSESKFWVAYVNGVPASLTQIWTGGEVPGVYWVATAPEFRRRGLATMLVSTAWQYALDQGARAVSLQPSEQGRAVYERMGFRNEGSFTRLIRPA